MLALVSTTTMGEFAISEISVHSNSNQSAPSCDEVHRAPRDNSLDRRDDATSDGNQQLVDFAGSNYNLSIASGCDNDDDMVSDISYISRHVDTATPGCRCSNRVFFPVLAFVIAMLVIGIVSSTSRSSYEASRSAMSYRSPGQLQTDPRSSLDDGVGMIVEFTVANLNTNAQNCTHITGTHSLQCVPYHNNSTNHFRVRLHPKWAPKGVQRFKELTDAEFWSDVRIFRVVPQFVSQFGLSSYPERQSEWDSPIDDDPDVGISNVRGMVSFASSGENTRSTQLFINTGDNQYLDKMGFTPIGQVMPAGETWGSMDVVDEIYSGYREDPNQMKIRQQGLMYLEDEFPKLSYFVKADFV